MAFLKVAALLLLAASASAQLLDENLEPQAYFDPNPQYTYSYQVAADQQQTYITHEESRDGDFVEGKYSYVDPLGNLITVTYTAGPEGYAEQRSIEAGFVQIRNAPVVPVQQVVERVVASNTGSSDKDLVATIISQLTPFIKNTVSTSLGSE